jgi:hypothetical protein
VTKAAFGTAFLWSTGTSSHQGGNRNNDWWRWEKQPSRTHDRTTSGDAAEFSMPRENGLG